MTSCRFLPMIIFLGIVGIDPAFAKFSSPLEVTVYPGKGGGANAYIFSDQQGTLLVDATRSSKDAKELATLVRSKGAAPHIILVTHGHPDHFMGLGVLRKEFPHAQIMVATREIKEDIIKFEKRMELMNWMESEPFMKSLSPSHPDGFDYENEISVLDSQKLTMPGGEVLDVQVDFQASEAPHETVLYSRELNSLFPSDLVYFGVHLWLGPGVNLAGMSNWDRELVRFKDKYGPLKSKVYPGHGRVTDTDVFEVDRRYMKDLLRVVAGSKSEVEARTKMKALYLDWENADFILFQSIKTQMQ